MKHRGWSWASAKATGTSHIKAGTGCDDAGACFEVQSARGPALVMIVSDGAGSAAKSSIGSRIACQTIGRAMKQAYRKHGIGAITRESVFEWLDDARDRIAQAAAKADATPRDFACTLVAALIGANEALVVQIGDGALVFRSNGKSEWQIANWPSHGEYAGTTYFVTDDPSPTVETIWIDGEIEEAVVFTDGLERLALSFEARSPFRPFFETMLGPLRISEATSRDRKLSSFLQKFIESDSVNERTDDDKTLILARRIE